MKNNQLGRSMIEMLGVLAIIGVLSVGGLEMMTKSRRSSQTSELISGVSSMANYLMQNRKYANEITSSSGYNGDCVKFLKQIGKIPTGFTYNSGAFNTKIGASVTATASGDGNFVISVSGVDRETCIKTAANAWGSRNTNRFLGVSVGDAENFGTAASSSLDIAGATTACSSATSNTINLGYRF